MNALVAARRLAQFRQWKEGFSTVFEHSESGAQLPVPVQEVGQECLHPFQLRRRSIYATRQVLYGIFFQEWLPGQNLLQFRFLLRTGVQPKFGENLKRRRRVELLALMPTDEGQWAGVANDALWRGIVERLDRTVGAASRELPVIARPQVRAAKVYVYSVSKVHVW